MIADNIEVKMSRIWTFLILERTQKYTVEDKATQTVACTSSHDAYLRFQQTEK